MERGIERIIGSSRAVQEMARRIRMVAPASGCVLITGESGTGKELVARAVHEESPRRDGPFVSFNASAVNDNLIESELFGHVKGAFTNATQSHRGLFEQAGGGTLFIDEIGEMSPAMQAKLLTAIEHRRIRPVGSEQEIHVDVRVIAATNKNLGEAMARREFRRDLYHRLEGFTIHCAPLTERLEDIPLLLSYFGGDRPLRVGREGLRALHAHAWPGNVRELRNVEERLRVFCPTGDVGPDEVAGALHSGSTPGVSLRELAGEIASTLGSAGEATDEQVRQLTRKVFERATGRRLERFRDVPRELARLLRQHPDQLPLFDLLPPRARHLLEEADDGPLRRALERSPAPVRPAESPPGGGVRSASTGVVAPAGASFSAWSSRPTNPNLWVAVPGAAAGLISCLLVLYGAGGDWAHYAIHAAVVTLLLLSVPALRGSQQAERIEGIQLACLAARDLRAWWKWTLVGWVLLYVTLAYAQFMGWMPASPVPTTAQRVCALALNLLQNLTTMFLLLCYEVASRRTILENRKRSEGAQGWVVAVIVLAVLESGTLAGAGLWPLQETFRWASGFAQGAALALLVGRLDSRYIQLPRPVIAALYLYAAIQGAWPAVGQQQRELALVLTTGALALKCLLALVVSWMLESAVIVLYLSFMRALDERIENLRARFLAAFQSGDAEDLGRILAEARGED